MKAQFEQALRNSPVAEPTAESPAGRGAQLVFKSAEGFDLALKSLDSTRDGGIKLLNSRTVADITYATVYIPPGEVRRFAKILDEYLTRETPNGAPRHKELVDSIEAIQAAVLRSLWTDVADFPEPSQRVWWEVWLRSDEDPLAKRFQQAATAVGLLLGRHVQLFPDRRILLVSGTAEQLGGSADVLDAIAELRLAKELPSAFTRLESRIQAEFVDDLANRVLPPPEEAPAVCLLDTGVNTGHRLLAPALAESHLFSYDPSWEVTDHNGHGTEMAGLALYGDLALALASSGPLALEHRLESAKIGSSVRRVGRSVDPKPCAWGGVERGPRDWSPRGNSSHE